MIQHKSFPHKPPHQKKLFHTQLHQLGICLLYQNFKTPQTYNTLTTPNLTENNNPPVVMATPHTRTSRGNNLTEVIIPDQNVQPKLKAQAGFVRKSVVLCPRLYLYHDEVRRYELMEQFT